MNLDAILWSEWIGVSIAAVLIAATILYVVWYGWFREEDETEED